jgi:hypothetical protein
VLDLFLETKVCLRLNVRLTAITLNELSYEADLGGFRGNVC